MKIELLHIVEVFGKEGYIDWNGNKTSQFIYDYTDDYKSGYAKVGIYDGEKLKYGVINLDGKQIIPCIYDDIDMDYSEDDIFYVEENNVIYIVSKDNIKIAEYTENGKIKFRELKELTELEDLYAENVYFFKDYIVVKNNDKYGFFDKQGEKKSDFIYDTLEIISSEYLFLVEKSGKKYVIDDSLNIIMDVSKFEDEGIEIDSIERERIIIKKDNKYGIADLNGNILIDPKYEKISAQTAQNGYFSIKEDNKYGVIDLNGNEIIKCSKKYKSSIIGNGEFFVVQKSNFKLLIIWWLLIIITVIIEIIIVKRFFKRKMA